MPEIATAPIPTAAPPAAPAPTANAPTPAAVADAKATLADKSATPAEVKEAIRMLKLKVEGHSDEVELPETEVVKLAAHNAETLIAARKHAEELAALKKRLQEDPDALLAELGHDPDKRAIERLNKKVQAQLEEESLTPEQKELKQLRAEREARAKADEDAKAAKAKAEKDELVKKQKDHFASVIIEALKQTTLPTGTPEDDLFTSKLLAQELKRSIQNKLFVNPALLAKQTEEMFRKSVKPVVSAMAPEHLADFLGADTLKALVKLYAQRQGLTAGQAKPAEKRPPTAAEKRAAEKAATQEYFGATRKAWRR